MDLELTATLNPPVPAFRAPADATVAVHLSAADIALLGRALEGHQTRLCESWERASDRRSAAEAAELSALMDRCSTLYAALREAARFVA